MKIGSHVSIQGGLPNAVKEALSYDANTFMIYTGAPRNTKRGTIEDLKIEEGYKLMKANNIDDFVVHAPYIINLASYKTDTFKLAVDFLNKEIERTEHLKSKYLVLHPGAYTDKDLSYGIDRIVEGLNTVLTNSTNLFVCLETMSGKGTEIGRNFEEIAEIISKTKYNEKLGVCFDTCHAHDSGYDIINDYDGVVNHFDKTIGLDKLKVYHINGSLNPMGAKKDRHANIGADENNPRGKDYIGFEVLKRVVHHKTVGNKPLILETPWLDSKTNLYKEEIERLRQK